MFIFYMSLNVHSILKSIIHSDTIRMQLSFAKAINLSFVLIHSSPRSTVDAEDAGIGLIVAVVIAVVVVVAIAIIVACLAVRKRRQQ